MNDVLRDTRERGWFWLDNAIIDEYLPKIGVTAFAVYACIVRHSDRAGNAFPSYSTLQKELACGRSQVAAAIKKIVDAGLVTITTGKRASNVYHVVTVSTSPKPELVPIQNQSHIGTGTSPGAEPELVPNRDSNKTQLTRPKEQESDTPEVLRTSAPTPNYPADFEQWWQACPQRMRRCAKSEAAKAWKNLNGVRPPLESLLTALADQSISHDWTKEGGRYVPMATTYLHKRRWEVDVGSMEIGANGRASPNGQYKTSAEKHDDMLIRFMKGTSDERRTEAGTGLPRGNLPAGHRG
jgi:hypothetical protein